MVNSFNELDFYLLTDWLHYSRMMPLDVLGRTCTILIEVASMLIAGS